MRFRSGFGGAELSVSKWRSVVCSYGTGCRQFHFYAQIHSMFDVAQGLVQGGQVGQAVVKYAQSDGAR